MNIDQKLTAIRDIIQQDVGNRGLARDPKDNLITACPDDFANACKSIADQKKPGIVVATGFFIPTGNPPTGETDGPLGALFIARLAKYIQGYVLIATDKYCRAALQAGLVFVGLKDYVGIFMREDNYPEGRMVIGYLPEPYLYPNPLTHLLAIERVGPAADNRCRTMRGIDITEHVSAAHEMFETEDRWETVATIGIGDGGNEIGMGKVPHETIVKNIPNGDLIHCRVATDHLIVAGVSNWGAYGLAAGVALLRGQQLPAELFDPDREREILQVMVDRGPLVDGVTGQQTATVDGLAWEQYIQPLVEIGKIVRG
jgi:hypothetical protein